MADEAQRALVNAQLVQLNQEVAAVASEVKDARNELRSCTDPTKEAKLQKIYDNLVAKERQLLEERLLERQLTGGGAGSSGAAMSGASGADLKEALKAALEEAGFKPSPGERAVSFSGVGSTMATSLYMKLGISLDEGLKTEGLLEPLGGFPNCGQFGMSNYPNEEAATADFLAHIQNALALQGVKFGRGGFEVMDLHKRKELYKIEVDDAVFTGGLDGGILPYGVASVMPQQQLRCGIEIKHSDLHKALYKEQHGGASGNEQGISFSGSAGGQALVELLAAYAFAEHPKVLLLLSSFDHNTVMEFDGEVVTRWMDISFDAAMYKIGQFLQACNADRHFRLQFVGLPQTEAEPIERLRKRLRPSNALLEQLDSVTAGMDTNAKFATALEFMHAYRPSMDWGDVPALMFS